MPGFLVFFVTDDVDDDLASAVRLQVRRLASSRPWRGHAPGFFDDPDPGEGLRTMGGYLRIEAPVGADALSLLSLAQAVSAERAVTVELQWQERILGHVRHGTPDPGLREAVRRAGAG